MDKVIQALASTAASLRVTGPWMVYRQSVLIFADTYPSMCLRFLLLLRRSPVCYRTSSPVTFSVQVLDGVL